MEKAKVLLLSCGEDVYPRQWLDKAIDEVRAGLGNLDISLEGAYTIMNEADAKAAREAAKGKDFDLIIVHFASWHITSYVMHVLKDYKHIPILAWGVGGKTDAGGKLHSPAAPAGITALLPVLREMGFKYKAIYEKPDEAHKYKEIESFANIARAYKRLRNSRVGLIGYADMGLYTCAYDRTFVAGKLGIDVEDYFSYEIGELMKKVAKEDIARTINEMKQRLTFENAVTEEVLERVARLYHTLKNKVDERGLDAISIKCVYGVTRYMGINPCMAQSLLANKDLSVICECDAYGLITNMMLSMLTGQTATFMENYEFFDDSILVGTCGFMPFDFVQGDLKARSTNLGDFFVGLSNVSKVKTGTMTFARLYKNGEKFAMFISKAEAEPPVKWIELGWEEPTPDFPSVMLKLEMPVQEYMEKVPGQHIILTYGDHVEELKELCKLLDIEPVS